MLVKILHFCVSPCAVCHLGIHQTGKKTIAAVREVLLLLEGCGESLSTRLTTACRKQISSLISSEPVSDSAGLLISYNQGKY